MKLNFTILLLLNTFLLFGSADSTLAIKYIEKSKSLAAHDADSALHYFEEGLKIYRDRDDLKAWIKSCSQVGTAFDIAGNADQALKVFQKGKTPQLWRSPIKVKEWASMGWLYTNEGYTYQYSLGKYDLAKVSFEEAKFVFEQKVKQLDLSIVHYVHYNLGNIYTRLGEHQAAKILLEKYKTVCLQEGDYKHAAMACNDLGVLYGELEDKEMLLQSYLEGLSYPSLDMVSLGLLQGNLAGFYFTEKELKKALKYALQAEKSVEEVIKYDMHHLGMAWKSNNYKLLGEIYSELKEFERAESHFEKSLKVMKAYYPDTLRREFAKIHHAIGNFYQSWEDYDKTLLHFQIALQSVLPEFKSKNSQEAPSATYFYAENSIWENLESKANVLALLYDKSGEISFLENSLNHYQLAFEAEQVYRNIHQFETSKLTTIEESRKRSEAAILAALKFEKEIKNGHGKRLAFDFAENNKSILLFEALKHSNARSIANFPDSLREAEATINEQITQLEKALFFIKQSNEVSKKHLDSLNNELLVARNANADLKATIEERFPAYHNLRYGEESELLSKIQERLEADEAMIEFFVGKEYVFLFLIKNTQFEVISIKKDFPLEDWIMQFRNDIEQFQFEQTEALCSSYTELATKLYDYLLKPLEAYSIPENLHIIPSGILGFLPFDALLKSNPEQLCQFKAYDYLIQHHNIVYNYSASLWLELIDRQGLKAVDDFAGFAPAFDEYSSAGFGQLKFNIPTLQSLQEMIGGQIFTQNKATKANFLKFAPSQRIIHFATHAQANAEEGNFSFIVLAGEQEGYDTLFVQDIYNQNLAAEMVFLGACETGFGKLHNGEGIISLARSFLYAGAGSVITTLWSVNDEVTKNITTNFYENLKKGQSKDISIKAAKLNHLQTKNLHPNFAHPVYWAAYTPVGNMSPVFGGKWQLLVTFFGLSLLVCLGFIKMKRKFGKRV